MHQWCQVYVHRSAWLVRIFSVRAGPRPARSVKMTVDSTFSLTEKRAFSLRRSPRSEASVNRTGFRNETMRFNSEMPGWVEPGPVEARSPGSHVDPTALMGGTPLASRVARSATRSPRGPPRTSQDLSVALHCLGRGSRRRVASSLAHQWTGRSRALPNIQEGRRPMEWLTGAPPPRLAPADASLEIRQ